MIKHKRYEYIHTGISGNNPHNDNMSMTSTLRIESFQYVQT